MEDRNILTVTGARRERHVDGEAPSPPLADFLYGARSR